MVFSRWLSAEGVRVIRAGIIEADPWAALGIRGLLAAEPGIQVVYVVNDLAGISHHTVDTCVKRIRVKLGVGNKAQLARAALTLAVA
jgi:tRNA G26 N,N-dimethylase Trm1